MHLRILLAILTFPLLLAAADAQEIVDFRRDVQPILEAHCIQCHGPDKAKNDFRVDEADSMSYYVEPGDLESSSLWTDYLITDDPDMKMPPPSKDHPNELTGAEMATLKLWIEEGAAYDWQREQDPAAATEEVEGPQMSTVTKLWLLQGLFHPASTHFPIALLSMSAVFLAMSFYFGKTLESAAFHCLWIGALAAIPACVMGWAYAVHEGRNGHPFSLEFLNSDIDRHRWLGIGVTVFALAMIPLAYSALKGESFKKKLVWFGACCLIALGTSIVGFQGGELVYGEGHYYKEYEKLFPAEVIAETPAPEKPADETPSPVAKQD